MAGASGPSGRGSSMQDIKKAIHVAVDLLKHGHGRRSRAIRDNQHRWASSRSNELPRRRCAECTGHHPKEEGCRNAVAVADGMDPWMLQESGLKCSYMAAVGEPTCEGMGHLRRHHARKSAKATGKGQGRPKEALRKEEKKGKSRGSPPRLDFSETHEMRVQDSRTRLRCPCADCLEGRAPRSPQDPDEEDRYVMWVHAQHETWQSQVDWTESC